MKKAGFIILNVFLFINVLKAQDFITVSDVLQDNMVIQQNQPFIIKGKAKPGSLVEIKVSWLADVFITSCDLEGAFRETVQVPKIESGDFSQHEIAIKNSESHLIIKNILIGDVWFCSGQSNMQFSLKEAIGGPKEIDESANSNIRLFSAQLNFSDTPIDKVIGKWDLCDSKSAENFSAVGYFFGKELHRKLNIPIGIIFSGIGASSAQAFVPKEYLLNNVELDDVYLQPYLRSEKSKEKIDGGFSFEKVTRPYLLYNAMINPFIDYPVKGVCWYQGESNHLERESYTALTQLLITSWREKFKQDNMPFYYVQIAPYAHGKEDDKIVFDAYFREAQERIGELNNTFMVSTMDLGDANDLHPKDKKPIGVRLANAALNRTYNKLDIHYLGPKVYQVDFKGHEAWVDYTAETISSGLKTNDNKDPKHFYLAGKDQVFYPARAEIIGSRIVVKSDKVKRPTALRYAFFNYPVSNLENGANVPALPYRTDRWIEPEE